jgi:hypothetical protein
MGGGNLPVLTVTKMNRCHGGVHFQHFADTPFHGACVAYNVSGFDCHLYLPFCLKWWYVVQETL